MTSLWNNLRYTLRAFHRVPLFTAVIVLALAFGIGANAAFFTLIAQVLLQSLPVKNPEQLAFVAMRGKQCGGRWAPMAFRIEVYEALRDGNRFLGMFCRYSLAVTMVTGNHTERVDAEFVSVSYFRVLGVEAVLGRTLTLDDDRLSGGNPIAMLSCEFWKTRFAAGPGRTGLSQNTRDRRTHAARSGSV